MTGRLVETSVVSVQSSRGQHGPCTKTSLHPGGNCF